GDTLLCVYEPAAFQAYEDKENNLTHLHCTGSWNAAEAMQIEPMEQEEGAEDTRFAGGAKERDLTSSTASMPELLRRQTERSADFWEDRKRVCPSAALDYGASPQQQQAGLKALNQLNQRHYSSRGR